MPREKEVIGFEIRLLEKMAERNIKQADLCRLTGLASSMVSHYCTGQRIPSVPAALKIAKVLRTTVDYLAYGNYSRSKKDADDALAVAENEVPYKAEPIIYECDVNEQAIIDKFRSLTDKGQEKVLGYVDDLAQIDKYQIWGFKQGGKPSR